MKGYRPASTGLGLQLTGIRSSGLPFNGRHPRNSYNYMNHYSFTDPEGIEGWVSLVGWPISADWYKQTRVMQLRKRIIIVKLNTIIKPSFFPMPNFLPASMRCTKAPWTYIIIFSQSLRQRRRVRLHYKNKFRTAYFSVKRRGGSRTFTTNYVWRQKFRRMRQLTRQPVTWIDNKILDRPYRRIR